MRSRVIAVVGALALLSGAVVLLRNETDPPTPPPSTDPVSLVKFLDDRVEYLPEGRPPVTPTDVELVALNPSSLRVTWTPPEGVGFAGYEVRWHDQVRYVLATETEITGLDPGSKTAVEIRAVDADGRRSAPARAETFPRHVYDSAWQDRLGVPVDHFDGPESLSGRRWRVYDAGNNDCLGLRALPGGKRLEITCDGVELQANTPMLLSPPDDEGAVGRAVLTVDDPLPSDGAIQSEVSIALLPEPYDDLPWLPVYGGMTRSEVLPPTAVVLHITPFGASFSLGAELRTTSRVVEVSGLSITPMPGVRHRWELRVLPDAVVALRDGVPMAATSVAVPWTSARPRLGFRNVERLTVDTFGIGGVSETSSPSSVVRLGPASREDRATSLGNVASSQFEGAGSVRVVASVYADDDAPVSVEFGGKTVAAKTMLPNAALGPNSPTVVYADFPLPDPALEDDPKLRLTSTTDIDTTGVELVVREGPKSPTRPLPRLTDRRPPALAAGEPTLTLVHESGVAPNSLFPRSGKAQVIVEVAAKEQAIAPIAGIEVDLDGKRIATLPTTEDGPTPGGRYQFAVDIGGLGTGGHEVAVRVLPQDPRLGVRTAEGRFEIAPT